MDGITRPICLDWASARGIAALLPLYDLLVVVTYRLALTGQNRRWELSDSFPVVCVFTVARFGVAVRFENL